MAIRNKRNNDKWGMVGPPINLEKNVRKLHKELFAQDDYVPTDKVKEISDKIIQKTGYR